jgi:hypothetical protein
MSACEGLVKFIRSVLDLRAAWELGIEASHRDAW